ncbi:MAG: FKBP-type peptidyl-prolyl cis-trans isomerase [Prevotella sp.]|nr:FKBP-type peptidyl-prolyl cis-trans isomerase [Prevotella sp.]
MKKMMFAAVAAVAAVMMYSCGNGTPKANLKTDVDTVSYALGIDQSQGLKEYLVGNMGIDTTYINEFIKGLNEGANAGDDKKKAAYYAGIQIGQQISNQMVKSINFQLFGNDSTKTISLKNLMAGFVSGVTGKGALMTPDSARQVAQNMMRQIKAKSLMKEFGPNKEAGEKFLAENAKKEGIVTLPSGVQYKVLKEGTGVIPVDTSMVKVHYEGRTLEGTVFDSSYKRGEPTKFRLDQVIAGWKDALKNMPAGSTWEVYVPQELAYGERQQGADIKPFSMLIFKIELLDVDPKDTQEAKK